MCDFIFTAMVELIFCLFEQERVEHNVGWRIVVQCFSELRKPRSKNKHFIELPSTYLCLLLSDLATVFPFSYHNYIPNGKGNKAAMRTDILF